MWAMQRQSTHRPSPWCCRSRGGACLGTRLDRQELEHIQLLHLLLLLLLLKVAPEQVVAISWYEDDE